MNWVGGSRNRLVMKQDAKKQKEFFEKKKMQQRLKNLGMTLPCSSPGDTGSGSMDLMTLFIVNQIATKKENQDAPKVAVLGRFKGSRHRRDNPLVLPMSPCSPSQLNLVESPSQSSIQEIRKRKNVISQKFKRPQLSPVLESAFSDNSASDYLPPLNDPFSSSSSASSGQGIFPLQKQPLPHYSPPSWDSALPQTQPFPIARGLTDSIYWDSKSDLPRFQLETPIAAQVLSGGPKLAKTETNKWDGSAATFFQSDDMEPRLDFPIHQLETKSLHEEEIFRKFDSDQDESKAFNFENPKPKISLTNETSVCSSEQTEPSATVRCSACCSCHHVLDFVNCTDTNSICLEQNTGLLHGCEYSPSCSKAGYFSSDSSDGDSCCESFLQASAFYGNKTCCEDHLISDCQRDPELSQPGRLTPPIVNVSHDVVENTTSPYETPESKQITLTSSQHLDQTQNSELCRCRKTPTETQEAGTQTVSSCTPDVSDASTQCTETRTARFSLYRPTVDMSEDPLTTDGLTDSEPQIQSASYKNSTNKGRWNKFTAVNCTKTILQRPANPLQGAFRPAAKENKEDRDVRGCDETSPQIKEVSAEGRQEVTPRLPEEAVTLQEMANILLLLMQRKKEE